VESAAPVLSRRHEVGAGSARGMLFTLLGEFVLPTEGAAWTSAVLAAFERLGVAEKATRQALMRTSNAGWLQPEKVGRRTGCSPRPRRSCSATGPSASTPSARP
jgi:phenylacetic acid degradation operon negative regulatory protein